MPLHSESHVPLRPLNILHDLPQVADLIELCFESTMDDDGQSYVQQMRKASKDQDFLRWAGRLMESTTMPLAGYVWEEDGKIIGNVSLVFQVHEGRKLALIANVATHPNYRRHGIGRTLTERAMLGARQKGAREIWLQVRDDNPTAIRIYADLGFVQRAHRTTYHSRSAFTSAAPTDGESPANPRADTPQISIARPAARHWQNQLAWLRRAHPDEISWYAHWDWMRLGPGLPNALYRFVVQYDMRQWAAAAGHELLASATWVPSYRQPNSLWLAAAPGGGPGVTRVLEAARNELAHYRRLTVEYPAGECRQEIEAAGFTVFRTLLWMSATGVEHPRIDQ